MQVPSPPCLSPSSSRRQLQPEPSFKPRLTRCERKKEIKTYARCQACVKGALASKSHRSHEVRGRHRRMKGSPGLKLRVCGARQSWQGPFCLLLAVCMQDKACCTYGRPPLALRACPSRRNDSGRRPSRLSGVDPGGRPDPRTSSPGGPAPNRLISTLGRGTSRRCGRGRAG